MDAPGDIGHLDAAPLGAGLGRGEVGRLGGRLVSCAHAVDMALRAIA